MSNALKKGLNGVASDSIILIIVRIVTMVLGMVVAKIMAVNFSPTQNGTYNQANLIQNTVTSLTILGLVDAVNFYYNRGYSLEKTKNYVATIFNIQYLIGIISAVLIIAVQTPLVVFYGHNNEELRGVLYFSAFLPLLANLTSMITTLFIAIGKAKGIAIRNFFVSLFQLLAVWLACRIFKDVKIVFIAYVISYVVQLVYFYWIFKKNAFLIKVTDGRMKYVKSILKFSIPIGIAVLVNALSRDMDKYVVNFYAQNEEVIGMYGFASKVLPFDVIAASFMTVMVPILTRSIAKEDYGNATNYFKMYLRVGIIFTWLIIAGFFVCSREFYLTLYDEKYIDGLNIFIIYLVVDVFRFANATIVLSASGKTAKLMIYSIGSLAINFALNIIFYKLFGLIGPALATLVITLVLYIVLLFEASRLLKTSVIRMFEWKEIIIILLTLCVACGIELGVKLLFRNVITNPFLLLLCCYGIYAVIIFLLNYKRAFRLLKNLNQIR